jgi:uncharacterized RDD family membrane protein YckC
MPRLKIPKARVVEVPASLWKRALAFIIDLFIINTVILFPLEKYFKSIIPATSYKDVARYVMENPSVTDKLTVIMIVISIIIVLYFSLSNYKTQTTLGKYLFRIRTKGAEKEAKYWQHLVGSLTFIPFMPFAVLWVIDPIYIMMSEKRQRLMERIAKLITIEEVAVR